MPHHEVTQLDRQRRPGAVDFRSLRELYKAATRPEKTRLLNELVQRTAYHRKHVVRRLRRDPVPRQRLYDQGVIEALVQVWRASGRACGKRLRLLMPSLIATMERDGRLPRDLLHRAMLINMSAATIDRLLAPVRRKASLSEIERHFESINEIAADLAEIEIPADLPPEERARLEALYGQVLDKAIQLASPRGRSALSTTG